MKCEFKGVKVRTDLTPKQAAFVDHLFGEANFDPKLATEMAGYGLGRSMYRKLMRNPKIQAAIEKRNIEVKKRSWLTEDAVLDRLWKEAQRTGKGSSHAARINALVVLGKHLGMFQEKQKNTGPANIEYNIINYNTPSLPEPKEIKAISEEKVVEAIEDNKQEVLDQIEVTDFSEEV